MKTKLTMTKRTKPAGALSVALSLAALIISTPMAQAFSWYFEIGPHFGPNVPSSAFGPVDYSYEFFGFSHGEAGVLLNGHVVGRTWEYGTTNHSPATAHGVVEFDGVGACSDICTCGVVTCYGRQSKNWLPPQPVYDPSTGNPMCSNGPFDTYVGGDFYEDQSAHLDDHFATEPCIVLTSTTESAPDNSWTITYTYPAQKPMCYYYDFADVGCGTSTLHTWIWGWSGYYRIDVHLEPGASLPAGKIPTLPGPVGGGGGSGPSANEGFAKRISAGQYHSLAAKFDGTVWAWGQNSHGQLGDGTTTLRVNPTQITSLSGVTGVSAGLSHSLALKSDGTVWAWGWNAYGQLGDGTTTQRLSPVQVSGLANVIAISGGDESSYAVKNDGTVWAWGRNASGQLGDGTQTQRLTPVQVINLSGVVHVAGGVSHALAVKSDGTAWAWGFNFSGQLGDGTTTSRLSPVQVVNLAGVATISGGADHSIALKTDGTVWAWGGNFYGQLGNGSTSPSLTPIQVSGLSGVSGLDAGTAQNLAVKSDGTVWAWGRNHVGQLGDGTTTDRSSPVQTSSLSQMTAVAAGDYHGLSAKQDRTLRSWGNNDWGQLGDGTGTQRLTPVTVVGFSF